MDGLLEAGGPREQSRATSTQVRVGGTAVAGQRVAVLTCMVTQAWLFMHS